MSMSDYRCYFVNFSDRIVGAKDVVAHTDAEAIMRARELTDCPAGCTIEVWQDNRLVRKNLWQDAPAQCA